MGIVCVCVYILFHIPFGVVLHVWRVCGGSDGEYICLEKDMHDCDRKHVFSDHVKLCKLLPNVGRNLTDK